ncbi:hypothetical protein BCR36DRAFT_403608 [Piromyces finnis]|uniref:ABC transporter domain-containing protein n=1 Tax=Piromyces finnis TaxID=1754191 RepID=A0A1Y1VDH8_9FUNG|nr:hypothetical protein BCR36DRAFT_403608 [Piromyces finnis]|eukprot:ORX53392.1 hypothetical protein BCR36DRAFT_403608 [Piromyces finnis]
MTLFNQIKTLIWKNYLTKTSDPNFAFYKNSPKTKFKINNDQYIFIISLIFTTIISFTLKPNTYKIDDYQREDVIGFKNKFQMSIYQNFRDEDFYMGFVFSDNIEKNEKLPQMIIQNEVFNMTNVKYEIFENEKSLDEFNENSGKNLLAGIVFTSSNNSSIDYTVKMKHTFVPKPSLKAIVPVTEYNDNITDADNYINYFVPIQLAVDQAIIQQKIGSPIHFSTKFGGLEMNINNRKSNMAISIICFLLNTSVFILTMTLPKYILYEKETGIKKTLTLMGVKTFSYYFSWIVIYVGLIIAFAIVIMIEDILLRNLSIANGICKCIFLILNGFSTLTLLSFISLFFKKTSSLINFLNYFMSFYYLILLEIDIFSENSNSSLNFLFFELILPGNAFSKALVDIQYNNYLKINCLKNFFSNTDLIYHAVCLILTIALFSILIYILENKLTEENKSIGFSVKRYLKKNSKDSTETCFHDERYADAIEQIETNEENAVEISNILKKFDSSFYALNNINFKVYKNEIFGILGHNGAGKTTLINIMTGLINPDQGNLYYNGKDFFKDKINIRKEFGICPQNCSLFENLTVEQNIKIFGKIKEINPNAIDILKEVDLSSKIHEKVSLLSGGQKKKLNIAIALIGNPKYIFLDEPTTGLDPLSRRKIWDLLKEKKNGRVIFLTTHYMDEADILTDRKLILHKGVIRCLGTSMFLKKHFNIMYNLKVETDDVSKTTKIIKSYIPEAIEPTIDKDVNNYIKSNENTNENSYKSISIFKLPISSSSHFSELINNLEKYKEVNDTIKNFSISLPSLEELFIKLSIENSRKDDNLKNNNENSSNKNDDSVLLIEKETKLPNLENLSKPSDSSIISSLVSFKYKLYFKDKGFLFCAYVLPIILSILIFISIKLFNEKKVNVFEPKEISYSQMYKDTLWNYNTNESNINIDLLKYGFGENVHTYDNQTLGDRIKKMNPKDKFYSLSIVGNNTNDIDYSFDITYNKTMPYTPPASLNAISNSILHSKNVNEQIRVFTQPFNYINNNSNIISSLLFCMMTAFILVFGIFKYAILIVHEKENGLKKKLHLNQVNKKSYWISALIVDSSMYFVTCFLIIIIGIIFHCDALYHGWSLISIVIIAILCSLSSILFQYVISLFFKSEMTASTLIPIINMVLFSSGYSLFLFINNTILNMNPILSLKSAIFVLLFTILYPPFAIIVGFNQIFTLHFYNTISGFELSLQSYLNFKIGFLPLFIALLISMFIYLLLLLTFDKDNASKNEAVSLDSQHNPNIMSKIEDSELLLKENDDLYNELLSVKKNKDTMPISILHLVKEFNANVTDRDAKNILKNKMVYQYGEIHPSFYNKKKSLVRTIIEDVTFGVKENECFGLLGPNGVGKSTLLNTIINNYSITSGNINFYGKDAFQTKTILGYCSQDNVLWNELNMIDHLILFLRIRGVSKAKAKEYALQYIHYCQLEEHKNKPVKKLSGGTSRKLSLLLAVCGYPKQIILDEPTAGVDPATRLFVWDMIKKIRDTTSGGGSHSSLILTTHSMEEAQELCNRLTILINGRLVCIGSPDYLRMKYSNSYILEVQTVEPSPDKIHTILFGEKENGERNEEEGEGVLMSHHYQLEKLSNHHYKYHIGIQQAIGTLFETLETAKSQHVILDYTLSQSTLEQVFINFVKQFNNDE